MKIRHRLTLWYFGVTLAILVTFSLGTYLGMRRLLFNALDEELSVVVDAIERSYDPATGAYRTEEWVTFARSRYFQSFYVVVYDAPGNCVFRSALAEAVALDIPLAEGGAANGVTLFGRSRDHGSVGSESESDAERMVTFRAISRLLSVDGRAAGRAAVAFPIGQLEASLEHLLKVLVVGIVAVLIAVGLGSLLLTNQTLHPLSDITRKARHIGHDRLNERIAVHNESDELGQLSIVLNQLFERLQRAFESQKMFLADAAHELKTPLSVLRAHWESEINNPELSLEMKKTIVQDTETITRLNHLINDLLLLSQTEGTQSSFQFKTLRLDTLLAEVIADAAMLTAMKSQEIVVGELSDVAVSADQTRLYQLFFNLLDNASKYTPEGGKIVLKMDLDDSWVKIRVEDNGPGISAEDLPHIFERFYRVQKDRGRRTGGTGLGLAICELIVEAHRGSIGVESQIGKGSVFTVRLPRANVGSGGD
jgi:signal transduction histidine kinase